MTTDLEQFIHDELETSSAVRIDVAPAAINVFFYPDEINDPHDALRVVLGAMIDSTTGKRLGDADVVLMKWGEVIDHHDHADDAEEDRAVTDLVNRVVDGFIERFGIAGVVSTEWGEAIDHPADGALNHG